MLIKEKSLKLPEIEIPLIDLDVPFSANQCLGILMMQPDIKFNSDYPFKWDNTNDGSNPSQKDLQLINLERFLDLGKEQGPSCLTRSIHFYIVSEYGIPGLEGVTLLLNKLEQSGSGEQVFIGGVDGLTKGEFMQLMDGSSYRPEYLTEWIARQSPGTWINCAIVVEKHGKKVRYFVQPKLLPSPEGEANTPMLQGKWVLLFRTPGEKPIKFIVSICFDWIGIEEGISKLLVIASSVPKTNTCPLEQWIAFVPQCNPQPSHANFMEQTRKFLWEDPWVSIHGRRAMVVMANSASLDGKNFGCSSFIFPQWSSFRLQHNNKNFDPLPSFTMLPRKTLRNCFEARLRKNRPAIHAVEAVLPYATADTSGEDHFPFRLAVVHSINRAAINDDPRYPNPPCPVCAYKKTISDYIDRLKQRNSFERSLESTELGTEKANAEDILLQEYGKSCFWDKILAKRVFKNLCRWVEHCDDCDRWEVSLEGVALDYLLSIRSLLRYADFDISDPNDFHGDLNLRTKLYKTLVADFGETPKQRELFKELDGAYANKNVLVIGTDRGQWPLNWKFTSARGEALNFTNAEPIFVSVMDMLNTMRGIRSKDELKNNILSVIGGV